MNNAKKPEKNKAVAQTAAENKPVVNEAPAAEVMTETKTTSVSSAAKPAAKTTTKKAASKTAAAKKTAAKPAAKKTAVKTAKAPKAAAKTTAKAAEKPTAKPTEKAAAKTTAKSAAKKTAKTEAAKAPAKRGGRKPAPVTIDTICAKLEKKIDKRKISSIKEKIAVEIEVWGFEDGSNSYMYVEIDNGKVTVSPHNYETKNFRVSLSFANAVAFVNGNTALKKLIESGDFYAEGNIVSAVKLAALF